MKFARNGVILHQILWGKQLMKMGILFNGENLTLNSVNSLIQLNTWLAGYEFILKEMTSKIFNWFIHTMMVYHVKH